MNYIARELSGSALLREDTGEWVKDQARRLMRAIEPLCAFACAVNARSGRTQRPSADTQHRRQLADDSSNKSMACALIFT
jgi:hypothetical protein